MNKSVISLLDLSDEILLIIFKKLKTIDIFYSLVDINKRLDRIIYDRFLTKSIDLVVISSNNDTDCISDHMLNRFCLDILPRIHQNVECLTLDSLALESILHATDYPNLNKLNLVQLNLEQALQHFHNDSSFANHFKNQITHLVVTITDDTESLSLENLAIDVYARIFSLFTNITHLDFGVCNYCRHLPLCIMDLPSNICFSSTIVYLCIEVFYFDDCLCLLDGRLPQMNTFIVTIDWFTSHSFWSVTIDNTKNLDNLKCFSLRSRCRITRYNTQIVPLLRRMTQLEKLTLSLDIYKQTTFIDGTHLNNEILNQMSHLHIFTFDIVTWCRINSENQISSDHIRRTFGQPMDCYIDYFSNGDGRCHIYSLPFTMRDIHSITNNFPGGIFMTVRILSLSDKIHSYEHDFFQRIVHSFPLLDSLTIFNSIPQQNEKQISSIVEFSHLSKLNLEYAHINYVEQFLFHTKTRLPCLNQFQIQFEHLVNVTEKFTNNLTRMNCTNIKRLLIRETIVHSNDFYLYFPSL